MAAEVIIDLQGVNKTFDGPAGPIQALKNVSLKVFSGEFVGVRGPSGSGKSTLINMITAIDRPSSGEVAVLAELYRDIERHQLAPLWPIAQSLMPLEPRPKTLPWLWRWKSLRQLAERSGELITIDRGGDRRVLSLANPGLEGRPFASSTLWGAIQYLNPGEHAGAHRHTPAAIRFVLEGNGVYTTVNGDACDMRPGDLILTPCWTWHDHNSESDRPMVWFDGLDMPSVINLDAVFFEQLPDDLLQDIEHRNRSEALYRGKGLVPSGGQPSPAHSPLLAYRWEETDAALAALLEEHGGPLVSVEFVNPTTGTPALPTMACEMHRLVPGDRSPTRRKVGSSVFVVYRGAGTTVINGQRFDWETGDMFVTPSWAAVDHQASEPSDLFSISDAPILKALGLYREQQLDEAQPVERVFEAA